MRPRRRGAGQFLAAAAFIAACALLPLLFVTPEPLWGDGEAAGSASPQPVSGRAAVFGRYWDGEIVRRRLELTSDDGGDVIACRILAAELLNGLRSDGTAPNLGDAQISYFSLEDSGLTLRIMEFSQSWTGDWRNWFSIHIDLDTHEVYRAYMSSQCLENFEAYTVEFPEAEEIADGWFGLLGCEGGEAAAGAEDPLPVETTEFSSSLETQFEIYYVSGGAEEMRYDVYVKFYEDEYPSMIRDLMFTMAQAGGTGA